MAYCDWDNFNYRTLDRNGYCGCCGNGILRNDKKALTFINQKGHYDTVIVCRDCCKRLIKFLNKNMELEDGKEK